MFSGFFQRQLNKISNKVFFTGFGLIVVFYVVWMIIDNKQYSYHETYLAYGIKVILVKFVIPLVIALIIRFSFRAKMLVATGVFVLLSFITHFIPIEKKHDDSEKMKTILLNSFNQAKRRNTDDSLNELGIYLSDSELDSLMKAQKQTSPSSK
jgi:predicted neutral ceramidase superfamily lipid hydrolase